MKINSFVILILIACCNLSVTGQRILEWSNDREFIHVKELEGADTVILGKIRALQIFEEYSFSQYKDTIYLCWVCEGDDSKAYCFNTHYITPNKAVEFLDYNCISSTEYKGLFDNGLRVELIPDGIHFTFSKGKLKTVCLGYPYVNPNEVKILLDMLSLYIL